jgi:hypothetical protein
MGKVKRGLMVRDGLAALGLLTMRVENSIPSW